MSLSFLLLQCPACLVRLTWIVFVMGGRWQYSYSFVGCCFQNLFNIVRSILVICARSYGFKYSYLIQIIFRQLYGFKYSFLMQIICIQLYGFIYGFKKWNHITVCKFFVLKRNTRIHKNVCKLFVLDWNTSNHIVCKLFVLSTVCKKWLNSITDVSLQECLWNEITHEGLYAIKQRNQETNQ